MKEIVVSFIRHDLDLKQSLVDKIDFGKSDVRFNAARCARKLITGDFPADRFKLPPIIMEGLVDDVFGSVNKAAILHFSSNLASAPDDELQIGNTTLKESERFDGMEIVLLPTEKTKSGLDIVGSDTNGKILYGKSIGYLPLQYDPKLLSLDLLDELIRLDMELAYVEGLRKKIREIHSLTTNKLP